MTDDSNVYFPTQYQEFIHLSRYARWIEDKGRRETWEETVDRYMNYMFDEKCEGKIDAGTREEVRDAILNLEVMPSMRCLMTAGKALRKDETAGYNCSFLAVDHPRAFDETLYILMCGTGVGFSVERQFTSRLPDIPEKLRPSKTIIKVEDSKIGWANAFAELINMLYLGRIPEYDTSRVRGAGERLKTFGGRASGPGPLIELFQFTIDIFKNASGRKLNSLECHDLMCKIGEIVVVGGVRRSALISLSNLSDDRMRHAKSGEWWNETPHRALANNSACYTEKPEPERFLREWIALIESKSGERGIFNREAARKVVERNGRRDPNHEFGCNPCVSIDSWTMTSEGPRQAGDLIGKPFTAIVDGGEYRCSTGFFKTGERTLYSVKLSNGMNIEITDNHPLLKAKITAKTEYLDWVELKDLKIGDVVKISNHGNCMSWDGPGDISVGYLLGQLVGDGGYIHPSGENKNPLGYVRFWGDSKEYMSDVAMRYVEASGIGHRSDLSGSGNGIYKQIAFTGLFNAALNFGVTECKTLTSDIEKSSSEFYRGFIRGFFDADGGVQGDHKKGVSVRLGQANLERLQTVQRMLSRLGIVSTIYEGRREEGYSLLPDGNGGLKEYYCNEMHELVIANDNILRYAELIGFEEPAKVARLNEVISSYVRRPNRERFASEIVSIEKLGVEDVYDCTVDDAHEFDCNGIRVHNCSEILLRSCGFCNLSEVVARENDTVEDLERKVRLATIIGTVQSTLTDFRYLRPIWKENADEECLLGVSITGVMDNAMLAGKEGKKILATNLDRLREYAISVNREWSKKLGVNQSVAITCNKPSGTVSQLVDSASGIHARFAPYYIRTVRADKKDPLAQFMMDMGFPYEDEFNKPDSVAVFKFPVKAPENATFVDDISAMDQLELWKTYQKHWTEHKPSVTVYVKEHEWVEVGAWVYKNFDEISGVSFLPHTGHSYKQAPYQEISKEEYLELLSEMPKDVEWVALQAYEVEDSTAGHKTLACSAAGGGCEEVDITKS